MAIDVPIDIVRLILSSQCIPCSTKVELQKELGVLVNRVVVPDELNRKLDRIYKSRRDVQKRSALSTVVLVDFESEDKRIHLCVALLDSSERYKLGYMFSFIHDDGSQVVVSRNNIMHELLWYDTTRIYQRN
jgi:hypothetical protein